MIACEMVVKFMVGWCSLSVFLALAWWLTAPMRHQWDKEERDRTLDLTGWRRGGK